MDTATKIRLEAAKTASKKVVNKTTEATGESIKKQNCWKICGTKAGAWCEFKKC